MRALVLSALILLGDEFKESSARLSQSIARRDFDQIKESLNQLPKSDPRAPRILFDVLRVSDWWTKGQIVDALADPAFLGPLVQELETGKRKEVKEVCALALEAHDGENVVAALKKSLSDADPRVRRAAVLALGSKVSRERADALIGRLGDEKDRAVQIHIVSTLEAWTKKKFGAKSADWSAWWKANRDQELDASALEVGEIVFEGFKLTHETMVMDRKDVGIVVLPEYAVRPDHARPYLDFLQAFGAVHYVRLPDPKEFATKKSANNKPIYPVDSMLGALEKLRSEFKEQKLVLVSHGLSGWLAMAYAHKHPGSVAALVLMGSHVDDDSFLAAATRARGEGTRRKDAGLEALGSYSQGNFTDWTTAHTVAKLSAFAMDPQDLILTRVLENYWETYGGAVVIPDIRENLQRGNQTPTLFIFGKHDPFSGLNEFGRAKNYLPASASVVFDQSGTYPYLTEPDKFEKAVSDLLSRVLRKR